MNQNSTKRIRILTGIKPTGVPHIGNYLGAIRPAILRAKDPQYLSFFFMANYHALTTVHQPQMLKEFTYEGVAAWLALGLNPTQTVFFRQSDVPEVMELSWILACFTSKGIMNRAHAYKALFDANISKDADADAGINMGIFTYPILMAADILLFQTDEVPVGQDQIQHIEMARDMAKAFNSRYGEIFKLPVAKIQEQVASLPGLDGRKMSKSYGNVIPLFLPSDKLRKLIMKIKTDSSDPSGPKNPDSSLLYKIYCSLVSEQKQQEMRNRYLAGIGWGEVKQLLFEELDNFLSAPRDEYLRLIGDKAELERILLRGGELAREDACKFLAMIRQQIGIV